MRIPALILLLLLTFGAAAQDYFKELKTYQQVYVDTHHVVKGDDKKLIRFFPVSKKYKVVADFTKNDDTSLLIMKTSGKIDKKFLRYGTLSFTIDKKRLRLTVYRSISLMSNPHYKDYLFIPFTDLTSGEESYGGGKYLDITIHDIQNNKLVLDFNKAYNPYCAYTTGYNCPIPPRENDLPVAIKAGEKDYKK